MDEIGISVGLFLVAAAFLAGYMDAVVGGGGLIQLPALFGSLPGQSAAVLLGTNKVSSLAGTTIAAWRYVRAVRLPWWVLAPMVMTAGLSSWLGAHAVSLVSRASVLVQLVAQGFAHAVDQDIAAGTFVLAVRRRPCQHESGPFHLGHEHEVGLHKTTSGFASYGCKKMHRYARFAYPVTSILPVLSDIITQPFGQVIFADFVGIYTKIEIA